MHRPLRLSANLAAVLGLLLPVLLQAQQPAAAAVTLQQFGKLKWLVGAWQGSGGGYPAFFEDYRMLDDSTIGMRSFAGADLSRVKDSARIELRGGAVYHHGRGTREVAVEFSGGTIHFVPAANGRGGFTFSRQAPDLWIATLHSDTPGGREIIYTMRRLKQ